MHSERWDALLTNSLWYVPAADLLAYRLTSDSPDTPTPASDQTLWSIGEVRNGRFNGSSAARIVDGSGGETQSLAQMQGVISRSGQVRITFTTPGGSTITGIGQVRRVNGQPSMEMQMITGAGGSYTTHWAYMLRADEGTVPPAPGPPNGGELDERNSAYRWLVGTSWSFRSRGGGKSDPGGTFTISNYRNGYFWGSGTSRSGQGSLEVLGSITPEGNLFFNVIDSDSFELRVSQGGLLRGDRRSARALLRPYDLEVGAWNRPLKMRLLTEPAFPRPAAMTAEMQKAAPLQAAPWATDPLIAGGIGAHPGRAGKAGRAFGRALFAGEPAASGLAGMAPPPALLAPPFGPGGLDQGLESRHSALAGLQQLAEPGSGWPG